MTLAYYRELLWGFAVLFGWLAIIPLGVAQYARVRFRALLKAPLTEEVEHLTHLWEQRAKVWTTAGLAMSGMSLLCFILWAVP